MSVPYTAHCPTCKAGRTFTLLHADPPARTFSVCCVVCGMPEREALIGQPVEPGRVIDLQARVIESQSATIDALRDALADRAVLTDDLSELRDELHHHATNPTAHGG